MHVRVCFCPEFNGRKWCSYLVSNRFPFYWSWNVCGCRTHPMIGASPLKIWSKQKPSRLVWRRWSLASSTAKQMIAEYHPWTAISVVTCCVSEPRVLVKNCLQRPIIVPPRWIRKNRTTVTLASIESWGSPGGGSSRSNFASKFWPIDSSNGLRSLAIKASRSYLVLREVPLESAAAGARSGKLNRVAVTLLSLIHLGRPKRPAIKEIEGKHWIAASNGSKIIALLWRG